MMTVSEVWPMMVVVWKTVLGPAVVAGASEVTATAEVAAEAEEDLGLQGFLEEDGKTVGLMVADALPVLLHFLVGLGAAPEPDG
jgi:hypothetical protein